MKVEHELKMNRTEMSMIRWTRGVKLNERKTFKTSEELGELLLLEPVSLMIKKSRLRYSLDLLNEKMIMTGSNVV